VNAYIEVPVMNGGKEELEIIFVRHITRMRRGYGSDKDFTVLHLTEGSSVASPTKITINVPYEKLESLLYNSELHYRELHSL
jgi:hypothetical protein